MTVNMVSVSITLDPSPADLDSHGAQVFPEGNFVFSPSGVMWPDLSNNPIAPMVQHGVLVAGAATVSLVASDNFGSGVLTWDVIINVRAMETINVPSVPVIFASGASQSIWSILSAAGWTPTPQP